MSKRCLFLSAALVFLCSSAWAQLMDSPWPKIHNNVENTGKTTNLGTAIGRIKWTKKTENSINSSPALDNSGRIYFGSLDTYFYCLDRESGDQIWRYKTGEAIEHCSPAIDINGVVYIGSNDKKLYAFDTKTIDINNPQPAWVVTTTSGIYGSPTIADNGYILFSSSDGFFYCIDPAAQLPYPAPNNAFISSVWWKKLPGGIWSTPTIDKTYYPIYSPYNRPTVTLGSLGFALSTELKYTRATSSVGCYFLNTDPTEVDITFSWFIFDIDTGDLIFEGPRGAGRLATEGSIVLTGPQSLLIPTEGAIFNDSWGFQDRTITTDYPTDNDCVDIGIPIVVSSSPSASGRIVGTPALLPEGSYYLGHGSTMTRFKPTGSEDFSITAAGDIRCSAAVDETFSVYFGCDGGVFYCINTITPGNPIRWKYPETGFIPKQDGNPAEIISSPAIDNDAKHSIYFGASDGYMYAFYDGASIEGKVTTDGTTPLSSVEIALKDSDEKVVLTTSTDTTGNFKFFGMPSGQYTVVPKKDGYIFNPTIAPVTLANLDAYVEFTAATAFTLKGRAVSAADGTGLPNVSIGLVTRNASNVVIFTDNSTVTDADGNYTIINIGYGNSVVTPSLSGWGFEPPSITQAIPAGTPGGQTYTLANFEGTLGYQISGKVIDPTILDNTTENGIENVTITLTGDSTFTPVSKSTNPQGQYSFTGLANGTYRVTPSRISYKFSPQSLDLQINSASFLNQNFYGATGLTISGTIKMSGTETSFDGFTVNLYRDDETFWSKIFNRNKPRVLVGTATVASNGYFIFMGVDSGKYVVEPSAAGYGFSPASTKVTALTDVANLIFTASAGFTISGKITTIFGIGQSDFAVNLYTSTGNFLSTTYTNTDGSYTFTGLEAGTYTVLPEPSSFYIVTPASKSVTITLESERKVNFIVISFCSKPIITLPFWGSDGDTVYIIGTNFGPPPTDNVTSVAITLSDGTEASLPAGIYFGTNDPATWVSAKFNDWTPVYITAKVPVLNGRFMRVWVVKPGLTTCITIAPTNFFINTRM